MSVRLYFSTTLVLISAVTITAQEELSKRTDEIDSSSIFIEQLKESNSLSWHQMFTNIPNDYYSFGKYHTEVDNLQKVFGIITLTGLLSFIDHDTWKSTEAFSKKNPFINDLKDKVLFLGDGKFSLIAAGLFSIYGLITDEKKHYKTSSNLVEALVTTGILVQVLKRSFGRESPAVATQEGGRWDLFPSLKKYQNNQPKYYAFPSGHIATLTATVTVIANNYPEEKWIVPVGYTAIGLVGISLVAKDWHWYSDLPLGIYLGYILGNIASPSSNKPESENKKLNSDKINLLPVVHPDFNGIQLVYNF